MKGKLSIILLSALCSAILMTGCSGSEEPSQAQTPPTPAQTTSMSSQMNSNDKNSSISNTNWKLSGCTSEDGTALTQEQIQENGGGAIAFGNSNTCQMTIFDQRINATYAENDGTIVLTIGNDSTTAVMENDTISLGWGGSNLIFTLE